MSTNNVKSFSAVLLFSICIMFFSCNGNKEDAEKILLQAQVDTLEKLHASEDSQLKDFSTFMDIISESLDSIAEQEKYIRFNNKGVEGRKLTRAE